MREAVEKSVAPLYRRLRRMKNGMLNRLDPPVLVLAYHRVTQLASDPHQLAVTPENFRAQMQYLRQSCRCVRFEDDWAEARTPAVAVTFDDGYADNLHQALPILEEAGVPATFFISTGMVGTCQEFWSDELERLVLGEASYPPLFALQDREYGGSWLTASREQRLVLHDRLHRCLLKIRPQRREDWLDQLRRWAGAEPVGRDAYRALTWEELRMLAASPLVTIGAHGVTHTPLAVLAEAEQRQEIVQSRSGLENMLGRDITVFSYPFGGYRQYDRTTRRLCREAGLRCAVTTFPGQVHSWTDPWQMPRQLVRDWDAATFAARLGSFWT
jgi:peptidoglycan/xylan/chitin deacetylase (PgdA/CDA1 family)